jgi:hypothetical protein
MAQVRTVDFLPEIFQTPVNTQFLAATLDQLVQEPQFVKTQGYVGQRVGPGVNPDDSYVVEPTASRTDYQLEPGVVLLKPNNTPWYQLADTEIADVITFPGINDSIALQGGYTNNSDRLYKSPYYCWDPFVDFDKMVNYNEYYWLPEGPNAVDVYASLIPTESAFNVTRDNGYYTFSGVPGDNPILTLVRGGNYLFNVAQNDVDTITYRVTNQGNSFYVIDYLQNPALTLVRGNTYIFNLNLDGNYPFFIKTKLSLGNIDVFDEGVTNNGATFGTVTFTVPQDAPDTLYYISGTEFNMNGTFSIVDATAGTGPGFWIQAAPGVTGTMPGNPNISSRTVLGVTNNGADLGTVQFNVPQKNAQSFYYNLNDLGNIGLVNSKIPFDQINNVFLEDFFTTHPHGIDGITDLNNKTMIFVGDAQTSGWFDVSQFDPLVRTTPPYVSESISYDDSPYDQQTYAQITDVIVSGSPDPLDGAPGSYDVLEFAQSTPIDDSAIRYSIWMINYVTADDGRQYIQLNSFKQVPTLSKMHVQYGNEWSNTQWYKDAVGYFQEVPLLTAAMDTLYYQDGLDPEMFGVIQLIDQKDNATLNVDDIIGQKNYTSPNGIVFTNGLKVTLLGSVTPTSYQDNTYYVEGVGSSIQLLPVTNFVTPETYTQSLTIPYDSTPYDVGNYAATLNAPVIPDYLTINRSSPDLNPWSRSNRWFHIDVIRQSATYNNAPLAVDNSFRAKRPILEFRGGTKLFDFGTEGKQPVNIIDLTQRDAFLNVEGQTSYDVDGYALSDGSRIIFAADTNEQVRNKIYVVEFITPDTVPPFIDEPIIHLVEATDGDVFANDDVVCLNGETLQGISFYFDGLVWVRSQQKTQNNQAPLFDVYDSNGISLSDPIIYPSSSFVGTKLFSYAVGTGVDDVVLGFPIAYKTLNNIGDIVFANNLYADTFNYVQNAQGQTEQISIGFVRQYSDRVNYVKEIGWQTAITPSIDRQQFQFKYDGTPLKLDVQVAVNNVVPAVQLWVGGLFQDYTNYTVTVTDIDTTITLNTIYDIGALVEVLVISDQVSSQGFYDVPMNLENNPFNNNFDDVTLGTVRTHYQSIAENLIGLKGPINGANNSRDLGDIIPYGLMILQQSSPLTLTGLFMRDQQYDIFASIAYNSREYVKYKGQLLNTVVSNEYDGMTTAEILDSAIDTMIAGRTDVNSFYWSDMLPHGSNTTETIYTVSAISTDTFNTAQTYSFTESNYQGLLVYLQTTIGNATETVLLERDIEYTVGVGTPTITILIPLQVGNKIIIDEYENTAGSFVPNTPSKMGLYPKFIPTMYYDTTYVDPTWVIRGHDGSITVAFGDIRDDILLEFEKRIYNNIKMDDNPIPIDYYDVVPGFFRKTQYTIQEVNTILSYDFLDWVGGNKLDFRTQNFIQNNPFTYNYSSAGSKLDSNFEVSNTNETPLPGAWRGIYEYFYDTDAPSTRPWEMLGFSEMPSYWEERYGPMPYTCNNLVLWDDLANGYIADPANPYYDPRFARPNLQSVIPVDSMGKLLTPIYSVVGQYDPTSFQKSWTVGDGSPTEAAWWSSSSFPFAVMRLLALTKPAEFFALFADRDLYRYDDTMGQYLYNGRYRLDANGIQVYGNGVSKASYINWIVDFNQQSGINSTDSLTMATQNLDVRLCYRMAGYTGKSFYNVYLDKGNPESNNIGMLVPPESYDIALYKNQPYSYVDYSALLIQVVDGGYAVYGYNNVAAFFNIFVSMANGALQTVSAGGATVRVPSQYTQNIVQVPYGYVFTNQTVVVDFILSYGRYLQSNGLIFDDVENGYVLDWMQMANEFLYFSEQGWANGTIINLNPAAKKLSASRATGVVDVIANISPTNIILDQNKKEIKLNNLVVNRFGNLFTMQPTTEQTICFIRLKYVDYEDILILNNVSVFNDLIYDPTTAQRQYRVRADGWITTGWNGTIDAPGFIINQPNVGNWKPNVKYTKGQIVYYQNSFWSAMDIVPPASKFDYSYWSPSNYAMTSSSFLQNTPNQANQLANSYDINTANLLLDNDLLSYGLTGFRRRQYMEALNLDAVSQVNVYLSFLKPKGTLNAAKLFNQANFGRETGDYDIFENWAVLISTYGANANRRFVEFQLNEGLLTSNPSTIQVINPQEYTQANQPILIQDIWNTSYPYTSPNIFPVTLSPYDGDSALPNAGYVDIDDVDLTVFNILDPSSLAGSISKIGLGTTIWAAKVNSYDWDVYRCTEVPGRITQIVNNISTNSTVTFSKIHNLSVGDLTVIRYVSDAVDGIYRVLSVPQPNQIVIEYAFIGNQTTIVNTNGLAFYLQTARVAQASDLMHLPFTNSLIPGSKVWVDDNGFGLWEVLEKKYQFNYVEQLYTETPTPHGRFGASIAQSSNNFAVITGVPSDNNGVGSVSPSFLAPDGTYVYKDTIYFNAANVRGFGTSVSYGNNNWAIAGAPQSSTNQGYALLMYLPTGNQAYTQTQILVCPDYNPMAPTNSLFGKSVTMSTDERWAIIGAPGINRAYLYARVDNDLQTVSYVTDGVSEIYSFANDLIVNPSNSNQIQVFLGGTELIQSLEYSVVGTNIVLNGVPIANQELIIARRITAQLDIQNFYDIYPLGGAGNNCDVVVSNIRGKYVLTVVNGGSGYHVGDVLTVFGNELGGSNPANNLTITVTQVSNIGAVVSTTISGTGVSQGNTFDLSPYLYTATTLESFTVMVNGTLMRPIYDYTFDPIDTSLTFVTVPAFGAVISVTAQTYWTNIGTMIGLDGSSFGSSVDLMTDGAQIVVGAPTQSTTVYSNGVPTTVRSGVAVVFNRGAINLTVTDASQTQYAIPIVPIQPSVLLNNAYLTNAATTPYGQYEINGQMLTINDNVTLTVGDVITINTNALTKIQVLNPETPFDEAQFGFNNTVSLNDAVIYIGEPYEGSSDPQGGAVERFTNQSRVYGTITTTIANPTLIAGTSIRINGYEVFVPGAPLNTVQGLAAAINAANIPNAVASTTSNLTFVGDGTTQNFFIGGIYSNAKSYTPLVTINGVTQTLGAAYFYDNTTQQIMFVVAPSKNAKIVVVSGFLTISVMNYAASEPGNRLSVLPGVTTTSAFPQLGVDLFAWTQTIRNPNPAPYTYFGYSLDIGNNDNTLVVGTPNGSVYEQMTFDGGTTYFDTHSTTVFDTINNSGVVYTYDYLNSVNESVDNPGHFVFGQQIYDASEVTNVNYGAAINYVGTQLIVGAPKQNSNGSVYVYQNPYNTPAWTQIHIQQPVVDVGLINSVFMYDRTINQDQHYFDFIDPLQGKILGEARRNIDYIGSVDPAFYNIGPIHNVGTTWGELHVGEIWWDTDTVRFVNPYQNDLSYAAKQWGQVFPGSSVDVYQWIQSSVPPNQYTGPGVPISTLTYSTDVVLNKQNIFETKYFFWVKGLDIIDIEGGKNLSTNGIASYIANPNGSGIPYVGVINSSAVAIYNGNEFLSAQNTILHVVYDQKLTDANVHTQYELITDGDPNSFLNDTLYRKLQDSFCGVDTRGAIVPDPKLNIAQKYGVQFRPRQSMFVDRFAALENYLTAANAIILQYPITESRSFVLLNSSDPIPPASTVINGQSVTLWNKEVATYDELTYQDLSLVPVGYKYLVLSDSTQNGLWTIYEVVVTGRVRSLALVTLETYDTSKYWSYVNWYAAGYNPTTKIVAQVANYSMLSTLSLTQVPIGKSVKVLANAAGMYEIYVRDDVDSWTRVGLQDGTIQFSEVLWDYQTWDSANNVGNFGWDVEPFDVQYFDQYPSIETRNIIQAINENIFIDEMAIFKNQLLILMFNYVYTEFYAPTWLNKTSLIDVDHRIRALLPYQTYQPDNQEFVADYLNEVKPYHVYIREFNLIYDGEDTYPGALTDFDCPAYYDTDLELPQFVSPILLPYTHAETTVRSETSDTPSDAAIWKMTPWKYWYENYLLGIQSVTITNQGYGYTIPPQVIVTGDCITQAEMVAIINSAGHVVGVDIINNGSGYTTTAAITFVGGNGYGAAGTALMGNGLVRSFKTTIKFDRCQYKPTVVVWLPNVPYYNGQLVRYLDRVWEANGTNGVVETPVFDPANWVLVNEGSLSGVDRTMGLYVPTVNMPGISLPLLISGIDYPGVQVYGSPFQTMGQGFDDVPFDEALINNVSGSFDYQAPTLPLDVIYSSSYLDLQLGLRPYDVVVDGGKYISEFASHAPEELVPGIEFDTMDFRVYTRSGADWTGNGHGFPEKTSSTSVTAIPQEISYSGLMQNIVSLVVSNETTGAVLVEHDDYTVNWMDGSISVFNGIGFNEVISLSAYGVGGGNQLYQNTYNGTIIDNTVVIPVQYAQIFEIALFVNGVSEPDYTFEASGNHQTQVVINGPTLTHNDVVTLVAIGPTISNGVVTDYGWSTAQTQIIDAQTGIVSYTLDNSTAYLNPINAIVNVNGSRVRSTACVQYTGDGIDTVYYLPSRLGFDESIITLSDIVVYVNSVMQYPVLNYVLDPVDLTGRTITFVTAPALNSTIIIGVNSGTSCVIQGNQLVFDQFVHSPPSTGDVITVTTWNDTREQNLLTQVFVGPVSSQVEVYEGFDSTPFDPVVRTAPECVSAEVGFDYWPYDTTTYDFQDAVVVSGHFDPLDGTPGTFDYSDQAGIVSNDLILDQVQTDPSRLWVTVNGVRLFPNYGFTLTQIEVGQGFDDVPFDSAYANNQPGSFSYLITETEVVLPFILNSTDVVMVTMDTQNIVPAPMAFRIFQDMRGLQETYRITPATTTTVAQPVMVGDDIIYVTDINNLSAPDLSINYWGVVSIDGERIMYRYIDYVNSTISGLLRGTAGTAEAPHEVGAYVYDFGIGNLLPESYQNYTVSNTTLANGKDWIFAAPDITVASNLTHAVQVYVGGILQPSEAYIIETVSPVTVSFNLPSEFALDPFDIDTFDGSPTPPPADGVDVGITVHRGVTWYDHGTTSASNGLPLQESTNYAARFLRGEV